MNRRMKIITGATGALVIAGVAAAGVATAADSGAEDSSDVTITGSDLERASVAAIAEAGGEGQVVDSEVEEPGEDDGNAYEVEVNLPNGQQIEVQLDSNFAVMGSNENAEGDDGDSD